MTKRVLSLLLALIMALSLCVPAFAADEPEVIEEEPATIATDEAAPVAVDEPAPAIADAEHLDDRALQGAVDKATDMEPGVKAGEYQYVTGLWPADYAPGYEYSIPGACQYFFDKLAAARQVLASITSHGGYDTWITIPGNSAIYETALKGLQDAVNLLTKYVRQEQIDKLQAWEAWYNEIIDENNDDDIGYAKGRYDTQPWFETAVKDALAFQEGMSGYDDGDYTSALYKDFVTADAAEAKLDGNRGGVSNQAMLPEYTDYIELRDAIDDARNKLATCDYFDLGDYPNDGVKVLTNYDNLIAAMKAMLDRATGAEPTGFDSDVTLRIVHEWLNTISSYLKKDNHSLKLDYFFITTDYKSVWAKVEDASGWKTDSHNYQIKISCGSKSVTGKKFSAYGMANGLASDSYSGKGADAKDLGIEDQGKLKNGAEIVAQLICTDCGKVIDEKKVTVNDEYNGPEITSATYTPDDITVKLNKNMFNSNGNKPSNEEYDNNQYRAATMTLSYNGTVVETKKIGEYDTVVTFTLKPVKLGDYTVELKVEEGKPSGHVYTWKSRGTKIVTVPNITTYVGVAGTDATWKLDGATGYPNLVLALEKASDTDGLYAKNGNTEKLKEQLASNAADAQKIVDAAETTPLSIANKAKVDAAIKALYAILKNFEEAADATALKDAIAAGEALVPSDYDNAADWKALQDAITAGKDLVKQLPLSKTAANAGKIAARAKAINDAIKKLATYDAVYPSTELNALKELIDSVPTRLAADDFSAASKAAVNAAVAAAKPLLDQKQVKRSEVNAAIEAVQDALNNLTTVKSDAAPAGPDNGGTTGWATAENGDYYYFKNGSLVKGDWVKSKGLWYHMGATGKMDTGFIHIVDKWGDGWYYLNPSNTKGTMGRMFTGWKMINDSSAGAWGWFETRNNGHQGQCTYTTNWGDFKNYKPF